MNAPLVFYHAHCSDGFGAAFAAWMALGDEAQYVPVVHSDAIPDVHNRPVYFLDIAFPVETMERVRTQASSLVVLDHHQTACDRLACWDCKGAHVLFDMHKSAARMSWEYFHPNVEMPELLAKVEDRDLLRWSLAESEPYLLSLDAGPMHFRRWRGILGMPFEHRTAFLERGRVLAAFLREMARDLGARRQRVTWDGVEGCLVQAPDKMHNVVAEELFKAENGLAFAMLWCIEGAGDGQRVKVGMRAGGQWNSRVVSEAMGGGGHPYSSAFRMPVEKLPALLKGGELSVTLK